MVSTWHEETQAQNDRHSDKVNTHQREATLDDSTTDQSVKSVMHAVSVNRPKPTP